MNPPARDPRSACAGRGGAGTGGVSRLFGSGRFAACLGHGVTARSGRARGWERSAGSDVSSPSADIPPVLTRPCSAALIEPGEVPGYRGRAPLLAGEVPSGFAFLCPSPFALWGPGGVGALKASGGAVDTLPGLGVEAGACCRPNCCLNHKFLILVLCGDLCGDALTCCHSAVSGKVF